MATILPAAKPGLLAFCQAHASVWASDPDAIGLSAGEVAQLAALTGEAAATAAARDAAHNAARAATLADNTAQAALHALASALVSRIKHRAETAADLNVYALAQIPAPRPPSPVPAPTQPTLLRATLVPGGGLAIHWKATNPTGTGSVVYQVARKLPGEATFTLVGFTGGRGKSFTDRTLPASSTGAQYMVQGVRGAVRGAISEMLTVHFGVGGVRGGDGAVFATVTPNVQSGGIKMAA